MPYAKGSGPSIVIALGGNALGNTPQEQLDLVRQTAVNIVDMIAEGANAIITHGNGPQVGMINSAFDAASKDAANKVPFMPFPECGAMSQGYIGYHLTQAIQGEMRERGLERNAVNVVTQTVVDKADPAFQNPTKPIGSFMTEDEAKAMAEATGADVREDAGRGWRRVVASPIPKRIVEFDSVQDLVENGYVVVSTGGGGIPVFEEDGRYVGVPAVIDKDRSASMLAAGFGADMLVILTAVEKVCINYGKEDQQELSHMSVADAERYIAEGQFAPGSMLPKVEACLDYVRAYPQGKALITSLECAAAGLRGETGTIISLD
ncbi:carbamate kinase [Eggerthellaceae bacterium zg-1084]|uniref:carbamate kinase n=1 Tax=Berryella wangjianweii TaxID=2734634 RepID=UPI001558311D|nr:carbamate kinase [Berryella wangjianweii]NPD30336.1 carbamate kinase [Berryella wangjianweii]NPD32639.1 carbamate kinase [Eggerthellaceae bacterium zg-997]